MIGKGSKLYSIFGMKCPKCQETPLFENKNPYQYDRFFAMPKTCPKCGQRFELEPAFYFGAMYVSYGVSVAYLVSVFVAMVVLYPSFNVNEYLAIAIGSLVLLGPYIFKLCRAIYINFFVNYDPKAIDDFNKMANM
jgi:uncharacterized protein (DUF983 family)